MSNDEWVIIILLFDNCYHMSEVWENLILSSSGDQDIETALDEFEKKSKYTKIQLLRWIANDSLNNYIKNSWMKFTKKPSPSRKVLRRTIIFNNFIKQLKWGVWRSKNDRLITDEEKYYAIRKMMTI